jgi:MFS family permease
MLIVLKVVLSTTRCYNYAEIMLNRFFLGFLESAVAPAFTVLVTFWWTRKEQALRTGLWYSCVGVDTTISPLINYGLGQIHNTLTTWKPLFLVLGSVTVVWSFVLFFCLPDSPLTTKGLTEEERAIAIRRLERNNAGTISRTFNKAQFFEAFRDFKLYSCTLIILLTGVPSGAIGTFGIIVINGFGFSHFDSLALTCPIGAITELSILLAGYVTRKVSNVRYFLIMIYALISVAGTIICWVGPRSNRGLLFAGIFLMAVQVAAVGLAVSLAASNVAGHTSKYISLVTYEHFLTSSRESNDLRWILRWKCHWPRDLWRFAWTIISRWICEKLHLSVPCSSYWSRDIRWAPKRKRKAGQNSWRPFGFAHH